MITRKICVDLPPTSTVGKATRWATEFRSLPVAFCLDWSAILSRGCLVCSGLYVAGFTELLLDIRLTTPKNVYSMFKLLDEYRGVKGITISDSVDEGILREFADVRAEFPNSCVDFYLRIGNDIERGLEIAGNAGLIGVIGDYRLYPHTLWTTLQLVIEPSELMYADLLGNVGGWESFRNIYVADNAIVYLSSNILLKSNLEQFVESLYKQLKQLDEQKKGAQDV